MELARFYFVRRNMRRDMTFLWRDLGTLRLSTNHENPGTLARCAARETLRLSRRHEG
jgi:hypothetical protein